MASLENTVKKIIVESKSSKKKESGKLITDLMIAEANVELSSKTEDEIERETAKKWGSRYVASKLLNQKNSMMYYSEAVEHAAATLDVDFYARILKELGPKPY